MKALDELNHDVIIFKAKNQEKITKRFQKAVGEVIRRNRLKRAQNRYEQYWRRLQAAVRIQ